MPVQYYLACDTCDEFIEILTSNKEGGYLLTICERDNNREIHCLKNEFPLINEEFQEFFMRHKSWGDIFGERGTHRLWIVDGTQLDHNCRK